MKLEGNEVPKEYFERNMYKNIAKFIPFPDAIQIKNNDSLFLLQNANYLAYSISETLMKKGAHCIVIVNKAKLRKFSCDEIMLYQTISAYSWEEILLEAKKKGMPYGIYLQIFFDSKKNTIFGSFEILSNLFGMGCHKLDYMKKDYDIINQIFKSASSEQATNLDTKTIIDSSVPDAQEYKHYLDNRFQKLFSKLDHISADILEGNINLLDEFGDVHAEIHQSQENILSNIQNLDKKMEQFIKEGQQQDLCKAFEDKIAVIQNLNQKSFPNIQLKEHIVFMLAFLRHPDGVHAIQHFLKDIEDENYKKDYRNKIREGNTAIYTAESDLGEYMVCKKDSVNILLQLSLKKQYVFDSAVSFFATRNQILKPTIYFDDKIFYKFTKLIQNAKQSIHIICPWVSDYALHFYEKDLEIAKNRNVKIFIKYGYLSEGSSLEKIRKTVITLLLRKLGFSILEKSLEMRFQ